MYLSLLRLRGDPEAAIDGETIDDGDDGIPGDFPSGETTREADSCVSLDRPRFEVGCRR